MPVRTKKSASSKIGIARVADPDTLPAAVSLAAAVAVSAAGAAVDPDDPDAWAGVAVGDDTVPDVAVRDV
jgi:hypothetical protein